MTPFEYIFGFTSIIIALAVTHLIVGIVALVRAGDRVRYSFVHALWVFAIFAIIIGNWAGGWSERDVTEWPAWSVLFKIVIPILEYAVCVFITPTAAEEGPIDLVAFHQREHRRYLGVTLVFAIVVQIYNFVAGGTPLLSEWLRDSVLTLSAIGALLLALFVSARWAQWAAAVVTAGLSLYFVTAATSLSG
jgi:hypothetical protein